jgi:hypothetical protein
MRNPPIVSVAVTWACSQVSSSATTSMRLSKTAPGRGSTSSEMPEARTKMSQATTNRTRISGVVNQGNNFLDITHSPSCSA